MIDRKAFEALTQVYGQHCISFFIPTHRAGQEPEDRIRYKNALSEVSNRLVNLGLPAESIDDILKEAKSKIDELKFWQHQSDSLAVFIYNGKTEYHELPIGLSSFIFIGNHLYLKPLLPILTGNARFYILAISRDEVKLYSADKYEIAEIDTAQYLPGSIHKMMSYLEEESQLQFHSGKPREDSAIFHGQGHSKDMEEVRLKEYLQMINKGIMDIMCDDDKEPLILATVEETAAIYRQVNEYHNLHPDYIAGNPDREDPVLLHEKAWQLIQPGVKSDLREDKEQIEPALAVKEASFSIHDIVPAAIAGRVRTLFVAKDDEIWGVYQQADHSIRIHEKRQKDSIPLLNEAAVRSYLNGGTVYVLPRVELPRPTGSLNAIYRYANLAV